MDISFNSNIKLLMGGSYCGSTAWNKNSNDIDNCFKLYYLREGKAIINSKDSCYTLTGPNLYFINGYTIDSQKSVSKIIVDWVHFQPESVYFNYLLQTVPCVCKLHMGSFQSFKPLFKQYNPYFLHRLNHINERIVKLEIQSFIQFAIASVFKVLDPQLFEKDNSILRLLPALEFINSNFTSEVKLHQIADVCYLSPNYFQRLFTQVFKTSPNNYIRQMRMEEAIRQLVYTNLAIKEIAFSIGYDDEAYFSRIFSKQYGISPGRYRKSNKGKLP